VIGTPTVARLPLPLLGFPPAILNERYGLISTVIVGPQLEVVDQRAEITPSVSAPGIISTFAVPNSA
jgi:hypothetical protein